MASERIDELVTSLTIEEKIALVHGTAPTETSGAAGYLPPIDRLGIGSIRMADGPLGVRLTEATAFPATIALGASFDVDLAELFGRSIGAEARAKGIDVLLAPGCNLVRVPQCGRTFEYYGEDPTHDANLASATVEGIQSRGVAATVKHFVANNQETDRADVSAEVDERTLKELYLPMFEAAVDADVASIMAAYNRINGTRATEHGRLLTDVLKTEIGFDGPVMSDWWAVQNGREAANAGLDLEMPGVGAIDAMWMATGRGTHLRQLEERWPDGVLGPNEITGVLLDWLTSSGMPVAEPSRFARSLPDALASVDLTRRRLDDMVRRVLTLHERVGALDGDRATMTVDYDIHRDVAMQIAVHGAVLLHNDGEVLPLDPTASVAVIGPNIDEAKLGGGGSSEVTPTETVSPVAGIRNLSDGRVIVERGHPPITQTSMFTVDLDPISRLGFGSGKTAHVDAARGAAAQGDAAIVVVQDDATEGRDKESLSLPGEQDRLISVIADAAPRTIVVLQTAGPVEMPWVDAVDAIIEMWYPGQEAGAALAAILYGTEDPGGRLPVTFASATGDYPANSTAQYPGIPGPAGYREASYEEGVFVGYRHFDERGIDPLFPFGHGRSYTRFEYRDLDVSMGETGLPKSIDVTVTNTGDRPGREVIQVYASAADGSSQRPPRELAGFAAVDLAEKAERVVTVPIADRAFSHYDDSDGEWITEPGECTILVGRSSRDIRERSRVILGNR